VKIEHIKVNLRLQSGQWRVHDIGSGDMPSLRAFLTKANRERTH
jgi:hypothetical protein